MSRRSLAFWVLAAVCLVAAAASVVLAASGGAGGRNASGGAFRVASLRDPVVFRGGDPDDLKTYGQLMVASRDDPAGTVRRTALRCDRVYFRAGRGLCLASDDAGTGLLARVLDGDLRVVHEVRLAGLPSRARISPDGIHGAVTTFVAGDSYSSAGAFSTRTTIIDLPHGRVLFELEDAKAHLPGGELADAPDLNFWGVTFSRDGDTFYATMATGGRTYLMKGTLSGRRLDALHTNVECPSLSPDETRVAYKRKVVDGQGFEWRLAVLDLRTMRTTRLAERHNVDDQAEWLDDHTVLYARDGATWAVPADGSGAPRRYLPGAESPSVVRRAEPRPGV